MTKRDYRKIALTIAMLPLTAKQRAEVSRGFATMLQHENPAFDVVAFLTACTVVQFGETPAND